MLAPGGTSRRCRIGTPGRWANGTSARTRTWWSAVVVEEPGRGEVLLRVAVPCRRLLGQADRREGDVDDVELLGERFDDDAEALDAVLEQLLAQ